MLIHVTSLAFQCGFGNPVDGEQGMHEVQAEDIVSILEYFKDLKDPRNTINRRHVLGNLIVICVLSVIAGADGPKAMGV